MTKKVNIIGAGLAGLSAGIFLQRDGIETQIFELAPWAGGMCSAWYNKGYRFEGCIHWMVGTRKGQQIYDIYNEVGALSDDTTVYNANCISVVSKGNLYNVPLELSQFRGFLLSLSEKDKLTIDLFCRDIDRMKRTRLRIGPSFSFAELLMRVKESCGFVSLVRKYKGKTVETVERSFESDIIRNIITMLMPKNYSALELLIMLGTRMGSNAGYPIGGTSGIIKGMTEKYISLGGRIHYNSKVDEILVLSGKAKGVRTNGVIYKSDGVVAACDVHDILEKMLRGRYKHPQLSALLTSAPLFEPLAAISFGLDKKFNIPFYVVYECPEGLGTAPGIKTYSYQLRSFECDKTSAPEGGSSVMAIFHAPLGYWEKLRFENRVLYKLQKEQLAEHLAAKIEEHYPGFKDAITVVDVATPATYARLTNVYKGSFGGFAPTSDVLKVKIKKTIPGLKCFCICGQWTAAGGGIPAAVADGKIAARLIKKAIP